MSDMRLVVSGAAGRMGRAVIRAIAETGGVVLAGTGGQFTGNIGNTGIISASFCGMLVENVGGTTYYGIIGNGGVITATADTGMYVSDVAGSVGAAFSGTIQNVGSITTSAGRGLDVCYVAYDNGGFIGNITNSGTISSYGTGLYVYDVGTSSFAGYIKNYGTISSQVADGMYVDYVSGVDVRNASGGVIGGVAGVVLDSNATSDTVQDAGEIAGTGGTAILLSGGGDNLELYNGYAIAGSAIGNGIDSELELAGAGGTFNLSDLGPQYENFHSFDMVSGAIWTLIGTGGAGIGTTSGLQVDSGATAVLAGQYTSGTVDSGGTLIVNSGGDAVTWTIAAGGTKITEAGGTGGVDDTVSGADIVDFGGTNISAVVVAGGELIVQNGGLALATDLAGGTAVVSGGSDTVVAGGVGSVQVGNGIAVLQGSSSEAVAFSATGSGGFVVDDSAGNTSAYSGTISGFGGATHTNSAQSIDLGDVAWGTGITGNFSNGVLAVSSGGTLVADIKLAGAYATLNFSFFDDGGTVGIHDPGAAAAGEAGQASAMTLFRSYLAGFAPITGIAGEAVVSGPLTEVATLAPPQQHG